MMRALVLALAVILNFHVHASLTDIVKSMLSPSPLKVEPTAENMYDAKVNTQVADKAEPVRQNGRPRIGSLINLIVKQKRKRNIGITISIRINETSVWTNGAKQNAFFMYQVYTYNNENNVYLVNLHHGTPANLLFDWNVEGLPIINLDEALDKDLDVMIESGMQISTDQMHRMQKLNIKVASFRTGNDYFMIAEELIFQRPVSTMFMTLNYDALWTLPAYDFIMDWQSTMFRTPVEKVPYVWSPFFHDRISALSPERPKYTPRPGKAKNIAMFEPNLYIVKNMVMPLTMIEAFYRKYPDLVKEVSVLNADKFVTETFPAFDAWTSVLNIVQHNKTKFLSRFRVPWFLANYGDVVISWQMHNDLNFLYLDTLYAHFPLVHNSRYFKECGYYYEDNNFTQAIAALEQAIIFHDQNIETYNKRADECIEKWSVYHPSSIDGYRTLVDNILATPDKFPVEAASQRAKRV